MNTTQARQPSLYTPPVGVIGKTHLPGTTRALRCVDLPHAAPVHPCL